MSAPPTFAEELARDLLTNFAGTFYVGTEFQREKIVKGAADLIDCRMQQVNSGVDKASNPT